MWMFLFGLIVGIILMILWYAYTKDRTDFSSTALQSTAYQSPETTTHSAQAVKHQSSAASPIDDLTSGTSDNLRSSSDSDSDVETAAVDSDSHAQPLTQPVSMAAPSPLVAPLEANTDHRITNADNKPVDLSPTTTEATQPVAANQADNQSPTSESETNLDQLAATTSSSITAADANNPVDIDALKADLPKAESDEADDLKQIKGVGPKLESMLNELGITTFKQVSLLNDQQSKEVSLAIKTFPDRIYRDQWIAQAKQLHADKYSG